MHVIHAIQYAGRRSFGVGAVAGPLVAEQRLAGMDARFWTLDSEDEAAEARRDYGLPPEALRRFEPTGPRSLGFSLGLRRAACAPAASQIEVVHQHGIWTGMSSGVAAWRRRHAGRTVVAPHGSLARWALRRSAWKKRLAALAYERENLAHASAIHVLSALEADQVRDYGLRVPLACIPAGISQAWLDSTGDAARFRTRHGLAPDTRLLLFLGRISPVKNLGSLIQAWARTGPAAQPWALVLAGTSEFGHEAELREVIRQAGLTDRIHWVGSLYGEDKRDAYAAAECFVLPSFTENFGVVVLEALACSRPALTSTGGPWDCLPTAGCGWRVEPTVDALAAALHELFASSPAHLAAMGVRARALAERDFTWPSICARTRQLYAWLRQGGTPPPFVSLP
jgi:glycosyltransferase involved in cell wall biosynthesis